MFSRLKNLIKLRSGKFPRDLDFCSCVVSFTNKEQHVFIRTTRPGLNIVEQDGAGEIKCFYNKHFEGCELRSSGLFHFTDYGPGVLNDILSVCDSTYAYFN